MRALWGRRKLGLKTMKGGAPKHSKVEGPNKKIPMTPAKLNTLLGESLIRNNIFLEKKIQWSPLITITKLVSHASLVVSERSL